MAEGKIVATLKAGRDFDAPWITIGADTPEELAALVDRAGHAGLGVAVANAAKGLQGTYTLAGGAKVQQVGYEATAPTAPPQAAPVAAPAAPAPTAPPADAMFCPHGQRTKGSGNTNGRPWTAFFCPLPKGDPSQCPPIWGK